MKIIQNIINILRTILTFLYKKRKEIGLNNFSNTDTSFKTSVKGNSNNVIINYNINININK